MLSSSAAWYILFADANTAQRAKILDSTIVQGHRLGVQIRVPSATTTKPDDKAAPTISAATAAAAEAVPRGAGAWRFLTITKKNPPVAKPTAVVTKRIRSPSVSSSSSEEDLAPTRRRFPSMSSMSELSEDELCLATSIKTVKSTESDEELSLVLPLVSDTATPSDIADVADEPLSKGKKRPAKAKVAKKAKRTRITSPVLELEPGIEATPPIAEIKLDMDIDGVIPIVTKIAKPKKPAKTAVERLFESGVVETEEDAYWLGVALDAAHNGVEPDLSDDEEDEEYTEKHPLYHTAGAWRAEGWKKIPQVSKSVYLPQRNQAQVSVEDASASTSQAQASGLTSGRTARVTGRRLAHDMETTRKTTIANTAESDLFAFNQLRIRKKQLRFARSAIDGYGLYAMEMIQPNEMICEYVGELCRSAVAEIREQRYLKQGIGSSYLFRIDGDMICDATFRGSVRWVDSWFAMYLALCFFLLLGVLTLLFFRSIFRERAEPSRLTLF